MQEYLNTETYEYKLAHTKPDGDWLEIPEGAEKATFFRGFIKFWKCGAARFAEDDSEWDFNYSLDCSGYLRALKDHGVEIIWQRPTQPEALPFIDDNPQSLNEQYAEIEQVRQTQIGGNHYSKLAIQPMEYSLANGLDAGQHTVIKYVTRFKDKGGIEDLQKAKHTIDLLIANYYGVEK